MGLEFTQSYLDLDWKLTESLIIVTRKIIYFIDICERNSRNIHLVIPEMLNLIEFCTDDSGTQTSLDKWTSFGLKNSNNIHFFLVLRDILFST